MMMMLMPNSSIRLVRHRLRRYWPQVRVGRMPFHGSSFFYGIELGIRVETKHAASTTSARRMGIHPHRVAAPAAAGGGGKGKRTLMVVGVEHTSPQRTRSPYRVRTRRAPAERREPRQARAVVQNVDPSAVRMHRYDHFCNLVCRSEEQLGAVRSSSFNVHQQQPFHLRLHLN